MQIPWKKEDESRLTEMWARGDTSAAIATALSVTPGAVTSKARRLGLPRRPNPVDSQVAQFAEHLSIHGSILEAGKATGMNFARAKDTFDRMCRKLGPQAR